MNKYLFITTAIIFLLSACSALPIKTAVKEDKFRFENFKRDDGPQIQQVYLMCWNKRPTSWAEPKQYDAGKHNLWVKATTSRRDLPNSTREAYANFQLEFEAGKSYMLNRKIEDDRISIWIQEVETGIAVSDVISATLDRPLLVENNLRNTQCESGSI